jgi:ACT domain-containing protein
MWGSGVLNIQTELEVEKRAKVELWLIVNTQREQMDDLSQQVKETEAARIID